jgi:hypothetical protein
VNRHRFDDDPGPDPTFCVDAGCIGQVNSWQILSVRNKTATRLFKQFWAEAMCI